MRGPFASLPLIHEEIDPNGVARHGFYLDSHRSAMEASYRVNCDIEGHYEGEIRKDGMNSVLNSIAPLIESGLESTNLNADSDYENPNRINVRISLEGTKMASGSQEIIEEILGICKDIDVDITSISCYKN